jgi:hypothetical protein
MLQKSNDITVRLSLSVTPHHLPVSALFMNSQPHLGYRAEPGAWDNASLQLDTFLIDACARINTIRLSSLAHQFFIITYTWTNPAIKHGSLHCSAFLNT